MEPPTTGLTAVCYVRASRMTDAAESTVATLRSYLTEGLLDGVVVRAWPDLIALSQATRESEAVAAFEEFTAWAKREGVSIRPPFARETRTSAITDESREVIVTPAVCIATYLNGQLVSVHPYTDGDERHAVDEAIESIRGRRYRPNAPALVEDRGARDRCPACAGDLVDGQGLYACSERDCDWVGIAVGPGEYRADLASRTDRPAPAAPMRH